MKTKNYLLTFLLVLVAQIGLKAQYNAIKGNDGTALLVSFNYGFNQPGGDWATRFNDFSNIHRVNFIPAIMPLSHIPYSGTH